MTLDELIDRLILLKDDGTCLGDEVVLFAMQPHYPMQCGVGGPMVLCEEDFEIEEIEGNLQYMEPDEREEAAIQIADLRKKREPVIYLTETRAGSKNSGAEFSPYAPRALFER